MKILHYISCIERTSGGTTAYMQLLAKELKNLVDLVIVTGISPHPVIIKGVKVHFLDFRFQKWFGLKAKFVTILQFEKPDIVHVNGIWNPQIWIFHQAAISLGIKVVLSPHGMLEPYILNRHPLKKKIALALYQHKAIQSADFLHATADSELINIRKLGYKQSVVVIPNGVDLSEIKQKTKWNKVQNILFLSRVHPKKGIEILIKAIATINNPDLKITIAGEGEANYIEQLKQLAREKGVGNQFNFAGGIYGAAKWQLYLDADLFVLPTYSENFGIVVAEALYTGLPVITTTGAPWSELDSEKCGWWIELNVDNLIKALKVALALESDKLYEMGLNGRKLIADKYDIKQVAQSMYTNYINFL